AQRPRPSKMVARNARSATDRVQRPAAVAVAAVAGDFSRNTTLAPKVTPKDPLRRAKSSGNGPQFLGALAIESEPTGATVFVNQRRAGETPVLLTALRAGSYVIRIEHEGYQRWTTAVDVSADHQRRVNASLHLDRAR